MAKCPLYAQGKCDQGSAMSKHGLRIHMGKIHGVHHDDVVEAEAPAMSADKNILSKPPDLVPCPCLFCKVRLPQEELRAHWARDHPTWKLHTGLYTWEV